LYIQLTFETSRFHLHKYESRYDPTLQPGRDVAYWLVEHLHARGYKVSQPRLAGRVWVVDASDTKFSYMLGVRAQQVENMENPDQGCWYLVVEKRRDLLEKLLFQNGVQPEEPLCAEIEHLLRRQIDFSGVRCRRHIFPP
jgi:hypothetical protein